MKSTAILRLARRIRLFSTLNLNNLVFGLAYLRYSFITSPRKLLLPKYQCDNEDFFMEQAEELLLSPGCVTHFYTIMLLSKVQRIEQ